MRYLLSYFIIFLFSGIVTAGVVFTIKLGFSRQSNVVLVTNAYRQFSDRFIASRQGVVAGIQQTVIARSTCSPPVIRNLSEENSIVNYLYNRDEDYSYNHRRNLAQKFQINNYSGSAADNELLLNRLKEEWIPCR